MGEKLFSNISVCEGYSNKRTRTIANGTQITRRLPHFVCRLNMGFGYLYPILRKQVT